MSMPRRSAANRKGRQFEFGLVGLFARDARDVRDDRFESIGHARVFELGIDDRSHPAASQIPAPERSRRERRLRGDTHHHAGENASIGTSVGLPSIISAKQRAVAGAK